MKPLHLGHDLLQHLMKPLTENRRQTLTEPAIKLTGRCVRGLNHDAGLHAITELKYCGTRSPSLFIWCSIPTYSSVGRSPHDNIALAFFLSLRSRFSNPRRLGTHREAPRGFPASGSDSFYVSTLLLMTKYSFEFYYENKY